jgi:two-component system, NtrC family, sensor kinase
MALNRWSLAQLVAWTGTAGLVALCLPLALYIAWNVTSAAEKSLAERGSALASSCAGQVVTPMLLEDQVRLYAVLQETLRADTDVRYVCVTNARGDVTAHTFGRAYPRGLADLWRGNQGKTVRFRSASGPLMDVAVPVMSGQLGTLHIGMSRSQALDTSRGMIWVMGFAFATAAALVVGGSRIIAAGVSAPLRELEGYVSRFPYESGLRRSEPGDAPEAEAFVVSGTREVQSLATGFVQMVSRLNSLQRDREATQARMINAERLAALGELSAGLAHEIHNPLDGMLECLRYLESDPNKGERAAKFYPMLRDGMERIAKVMRQMLAFAGTGQHVNLEACHMGEMTESLALLLEAPMKERGIRLTCTGVACCYCICDRHGLSQAVLNLALNAAEAAEASPNPAVEIEIVCDTTQVHLSVEDTGPGVPEDERERIFEAFYTTKAPGKGTGLGLAVSRGLIRAAGGDISLAPEPGRLGGARFVVSLPKCNTSGERE